MTTATPTAVPTGMTAQALLDALRSNTLVLSEIAMRYGIETHSLHAPKILPSSPRPTTCGGCWGGRWPRSHRSS